MMGGLAYMTGRPGDPLRAGASVNDIMGGMFGAIGAMAALAQRERTGEGQEVQSALFENNVFLVAQHMLQYAVTGKPAAPMPGRISAWAVYDVFQARGGDQIFLAVVSDTQWAIFCEAFGYSRPEGRHTPEDQQRPRPRPRVADPAAARTHRATRRGRTGARSSRPTACPSRPSPSRRRCWTTRTCWPPAASRPSPCPTAARARPCCCCR
jgi:crotonobetainyl-CoA:carnitine CoA-transferase CaiB-like acyl-CoA transferase